ncbi:MAG TPA: hypothetical protein VK558_10420 [Patescibacteria group bacterium]|nr:hypothetical protein [Patescibacteria group bacterium]
MAGCSTADLLPGRTKAPYMAKQAGWSFGMVDAAPFFLATALSPLSPGNRPLAVYIEGDGLAFISRHTPSSDPTPTNPTALLLALAHPGPAAYIGRPCQFTDPTTARHCDVAYWTNLRYAPEVIDSVGLAIDDLKRRSGARRVILVGYSGGGAVAALLAARRSDVVGLVTVSANLDLGYWVGHAGFSPLTGSLDPADDAPRLKDLPQVHFVGRRDKVVEPAVARSFLARMGGDSARLIEIPEADHTCCWIKSWRELSRRPEMYMIEGWNSE